MKSNLFKFIYPSGRWFIARAFVSTMGQIIKTSPRCYHEVGEIIGVVHLKRMTRRDILKYLL